MFLRVTETDLTGKIRVNVLQPLYYVFTLIVEECRVTLLQSCTVVIHVKILPLACKI